MTELPPIEDKIQQIFKFLEIADVSKWQGMNVFEAGDADSLYGVLKTAFEQVESETEKRVIEENKITENTSDGYHTFKELYEFRKAYNIAFFNEVAEFHKSRTSIRYDIHKSKRHSDGQECFGGGWFIVVAELPTGQISNHYEMKDWDLFDIPEKERANTFDGHTPNDVLTRLINLSLPNPKPIKNK